MVEGPDGGSVAKRRSVWRVLLASFCFALSLGVVQAQPAQALVLPWPTIGAVLTEVGEAAEIVAVGGTAVTVGTAGAAVAAVAVAGVMAYQSRDIWLPWVNQLLIEAGVKDQGGNCGNPSCRPDWVKVVGGSIDTYVVHATVDITPCYPGGCIDVMVYENGGCKDGSGWNWGSGYVRQAVVTFDSPQLCVGHGGVSYANVQGAIGAGRSDWFTITPGSSWTAANNQTTTTVQCKNALTAAVQTITATTTGEDGHWLMPSCEARLGDAWHPADVQVAIGPQGGTSTVVAHVVEHSLDRYHDCFDPSTGAMICRVRVWVDGAPCQIGDAHCLDWQQYLADNPGTVQCKFGSYVIAIKNCDALAHAYDTKTQTRTVSTTNPDGSPKVPTQDAPPPAPDMTKGTTPTPGTTDPNASEGSCMGAAWTWNPVDWVYVPIKCGLKWAFVPSSATMTATSTAIQTDWNNSSPGQWLNAFKALAPTNSGGSSCSGLHVNLNLGGGLDEGMDFFSTCSEPWTTIAAGARLLGTAFLVYFGGLACVRALGSGLGWNPGIGGGGTD